MSAHSVSESLGRIVWHDLMTNDATAAQAFYAAVFGWTYETANMGEMGDYIMIAHHGISFGGMVPMDPDDSVPSHWVPYIDVPNVDDVAERAAAHGGTVVVEPMDIPDVGRFAVVVDPEGAVWAPMRADFGEPPVWPGAPAVTWNEVVVEDQDQAIAHYTALIGWNASQVNMGGSAPYAVFANADASQAGIQPRPEGIATSFWLAYFSVASLEEASAAVTANGGLLLGPVIDVPDVGRVQWAADPAGAILALHEPVVVA